MRTLRFSGAYRRARTAVVGRLVGCLRDIASLVDQAMAAIDWSEELHCRASHGFPQELGGDLLHHGA